VSATGRVVGFGEVLLRLKSPGNERLLQSPSLEATFGGAEANVIASLAQFGLPTAFATALPANPLGDAAIAALRAFGIDTSSIVRSGDRVGVYYLEAGAGPRASGVTYDRAGSSLATARREEFDWRTILAGARWLHISGITPAISGEAAAITLDAARAARAAGITVSCDYNNRAKLWQWGKHPRDVMPEIVRQVDIGIAGRDDCQTMLGVEAPETSGAPNATAYGDLAAAVIEAYPNLKKQVITLRDGATADSQGWSACMHDGSRLYTSRRYQLDGIIDRVGGGDAFSAGLIYGLLAYNDDARALEFATAASALKHFVPGDVNRVSVAEVEGLVAGEGGGRIRR
jgi:2-dehydro-3-deoxygluconokinase